VLWRWTLANVPWRTLVLHAATIVDTARNLYGVTRTPVAPVPPRSRRAEGLEALRQALEEFEDREVRQAALFEDLARQVQEMTLALEVLRVRVLFCLMGAALAVVIAIVAVGLLLLRAR